MGKLLEWGYVFPIDRTKSDRGALRTAMARLEAGNFVGIFPEKGIRFGKTSVLGGAELPIGTRIVVEDDGRAGDPDGHHRLGPDVRVDELLQAPACVRARRPGAVAGQKGDEGGPARRIAQAWRELYASLIRDYNIQPDELPKSAQERWGRPVPAQE